MKKVAAIKLCLKIVLLSLLFSGCVSSNVSESEDEKALRVIEKDIDDFRADLRALERVRGEPLGREVFIALDDAKQAVKCGDYEGVLDHYVDALSLIRNHVADENTINAFEVALDNICVRLDDKGHHRKNFIGELDKLKRIARGELVITAEMEIEDKLKSIIIPEFSMKPPATIIDAVDFFKQASIDFANPEIPIERRGVGFVLVLSPPSSEDGEGNAETGVPVIPEINAKYISLYDAINLVCDLTDLEFVIRGYTATIRPFGECDDESDEDVEAVEF